MSSIKTPNKGRITVQKNGIFITLKFLLLAQRISGKAENLQSTTGYARNKKSYSKKGVL